MSLFGLPRHCQDPHLQAYFCLQDHGVACLTVKVVHMNVYDVLEPTCIAHTQLKSKLDCLWLASLQLFLFVTDRLALFMIRHGKLEALCLNVHHGLSQHATLKPLIKCR